MDLLLCLLVFAGLWFVFGCGLIVLFSLGLVANVDLLDFTHVAL